MEREPHEAPGSLEALARDVMKLAQSTLLVDLRFLDAALMQLRLAPCQEFPLATLGRELYYEPKHILTCYARERELPVRDYLHLALHCVFRHMFVHPGVERARWNLACDIAVEGIISELDLPAARAKRQAEQGPVLQQLRARIRPLSAEKLYYHLGEAMLDDARLEELARLFRADDHRLWYLPKAAVVSPEARVRTPDSAEAVQLEQLWRDVSERMRLDVELFARHWGDRAGSLVQNLKAVNRERYNYETFLRRFAVRGEALKVNDDEFDEIFYTYGLNLYGNVPLIEPLEYGEVSRIREFAIALDTSGSTSGELAQAFVQKTYNILKSSESFFTRINLHIIQCDAAIQEDVKITSQREFDAYLARMELRGLGGTDFRPVFEYVDSLIEQGEFTNLKGLIYFTDGYGTFPDRKPAYDVAFAFIDDGERDPVVPPWAIRLLLPPEEILREPREGDAPV